MQKKTSDADTKIPDNSRVAKKTDYNAKITEMESKIPCITLLATNAALFIVENKLPNVSNLA